jgi:hypothetical protein
MLESENESLRAELMRQQKEAERAREQVYRLRFSSIACRLRSNKPPETGTRAYLHSCRTYYTPPSCMAQAADKERRCADEEVQRLAAETLLQEVQRRNDELEKRISQLVCFIHFSGELRWLLSCKHAARAMDTCVRLHACNGVDRCWSRNVLPLI